MLWVRHTRAHSPRTFTNPRNRNCRNPRACLICPKTGSTIVLRAAYTARPALVCSLRFMRSTRARLAVFAMLLLASGDIAIDLVPRRVGRFQMLQILLRTVTTVGQ